MPITMYHNPRCSKSRETLKLLQQEGLEPKIVEYLKTPPDEKTLKGLLKKLGMKPRELMRTKEKAYKENKLDDPALSDDQLIAAMVKFPILIERPIVVKDNAAALGRPPQDVLEIL